MKAVRAIPASAWLFALVAATWQALAMARILDPLFFPPPSRLLEALGSLLWSGELGREGSRTLVRAAVGFVAGAVTGIAAAALLSSRPWLHRATRPAIGALYSSPKLTLLPMLMLLFGVNETSRILLIAMSSFLLVVTQVSDAIRNVNPAYVDMAVNYGASHAMVVRKVYLPACLPYIFTALRLAFGRSLVLTISIELLSGQDGLGSMIWSAWQTFAVEKLYVSVILAAAAGLVFQELFQLLEAAPCTLGNPRMILRDLDYYARMAYGVCAILRYPRIRDHASVLREQMAQREPRFLELVKRIVFANPANPYHEMFRLAGCGYEDLARGVARDGLEDTLRALAGEGVLLTHDEFKGKTPVVRAGREIASTPESWTNPLVPGHLESRSGGSRSAGTRTRYSTRLQVYREVYEDLVTNEFALSSRVRTFVGPILPSSLAIADALRLERAGLKQEKWFAMPGALREDGHYRAVTHVLVRFARIMGASLPFPTSLPANDFTPVARWVADRKREGQSVMVRGFVSPLLRVAAAATDLGLDIAGTMFLVGGEALTEAKRRGFEAAGCEVFPRYSIAEIGAIGFACRQMRAGNCVHLFNDSVAVTSRARRAPFTETEVNSLLFTTLLPFAPRFLINVEMDDAGILEPATCRCAFSAAGMNVQVRDIFSYGKLTGQGITLCGTDVVPMLERTLPQRFGGAAGDYQLVEIEGTGQTRLVLRISPRVGITGTAEVRDFLLAEIRRCYGGALAARLWKHSAGLNAVIEEPAATSNGKVLPLHLLGSEQKHAHRA